MIDHFVLDWLVGTRRGCATGILLLLLGLGVAAILLRRIDPGIGWPLASAVALPGIVVIAQIPERRG